jgi:hypothetical protein
VAVYLFSHALRTCYPDRSELLHFFIKKVKELREYPFYGRVQGAIEMNTTKGSVTTRINIIYEKNQGVLRIGV